MQPSKPSIRTLAVFGLLVIGIICSFALHAALTDMSVTYTATAVQPGGDPSRVADASRHIDNLDERLMNGEISEDLYNKLREKWEGRLEDLK